MRPTEESSWESLLSFHDCRTLSVFQVNSKQRVSAYRTEAGNTNNYWYACELEGGHLEDGSARRRAADFCRLCEQSLDLDRELGHNTFHFSVEWSRIEPRQGESHIKEIEHYCKLLNAVKKRGLEGPK